MKLQFFKPKIMPFNKGGNRIILREPARFSSSKAPLGTKRAERILIKRDFGAKTTEVKLFYDSDERLIGQNRENKENDNITDYIESRYTVRKKVQSGKYLISLSDVQSINYAPDKSINSAVRHKVDIVKEKGIERPSINIIKYHATKNSDNNFAETFSIANQQNYIQTESVRSESGDLLEITTTASENIPEKVAKDEYLVLRGMPDEIAIKTLFRLLGKKENIENLDDINLFYIKGDDMNYEMGVSLQDQNKLGVATMPVLGYNINTTAHELRHFRQHELKNKLKKQLWNKFFNKKEYNSRELKLALYFLKCRLQECPFPVCALTRKWYMASGVEKDAYRIGDRFEADFQRRTKELKEFFPKVTRHNMGIEPILPD
ncbi:MAG: hypothetical protein NC408_02880 [Candidatus Gastranaerophilales bacterium]|nr:hypothetical protein [Candidatus Gastranaerophilales bacterium]MCM1072954.1 hypothetical protein [Bacteroides sp.]